MTVSTSSLGGRVRMDTFKRLLFGNSYIISPYLRYTVYHLGTRNMERFSRPGLGPENIGIVVFIKHCL